MVNRRRGEDPLPILDGYHQDKQATGREDLEGFCVK